MLHQSGGVGVKYCRCREAHTYPLQYMKQKSRNVVQEITIIKTCQQSKLHCKTILITGLGRENSNIFQIEKQKTQKCGIFNFDKYVMIIS